MNSNHLIGVFRDGQWHFPTPEIVTHANIRDYSIAVGNKVKWFDIGGSHESIVTNIIKRFTTVSYEFVYDLEVQDSNGDAHTLNNAEHYGVSKID